MSDEQGQAEKPADAWGQPISEERQAELQGYLDQWAAETDHGQRMGPFDTQQSQEYGVSLNGADIFWLAEKLRLNNHFRTVPDLHLEGADLGSAHLDGANLREVHLERANLLGANLKGAHLGGAHLESAYLSGAHLERAALSDIFGPGRGISDAQLKKFMQSDTYLGNESLHFAHLENADLNHAYMEGTSLRGVHLEHADLTEATFDRDTSLNDAVLTDASLDQVVFDQVNLTVVDWSLVDTLGDERTAHDAKGSNGQPKNRETRLDDFKAAVRANRVLAIALQAQGLSEDASRFAYRAQVLQRQLLRRQRKVGAYLFSVLLAALAGYGYRLNRIFRVYGLVVLLFALGYFLAGGIAGQGNVALPQQALDALQVSLNAIHGRVFFTQLGLDTLQSWLATLESIVGIVIEGVFVAMLIQRFFGR